MTTNNNLSIFSNSLNLLSLIKTNKFSASDYLMISSVHCKYRSTKNTLFGIMCTIHFFPNKVHPSLCASERSNNNMACLGTHVLVHDPHDELRNLDVQLIKSYTSIKSTVYTHNLSAPSGKKLREVTV